MGLDVEIDKNCCILADKTQTQTNSCGSPIVCSLEPFTSNTDCVQSTTVTRSDMTKRFSCVELDYVWMKAKSAQCDNDLIQLRPQQHHAYRCTYTYASSYVHRMLYRIKFSTGSVRLLSPSTFGKSIHWINSERRQVPNSFGMDAGGTFSKRVGRGSEEGYPWYTLDYRIMCIDSICRYNVFPMIFLFFHFCTH